VGLLSTEAKESAANIEKRLQLGSKLSDVARCEEDVLQLLSLYKNENYILSEHRGRYCVSNLNYISNVCILVEYGAFFSQSKVLDLKLYTVIFVEVSVLSNSINEH